MDSQNPTGPVTLELYVRSLAPYGSTAQLEGVLDRLDRLEETGTVARYSVEVWGRQVRPATDAPAAVPTDVHDRLAAFRSWADSNGASLDPFFETKEVRVSFTDEAYTVVDLPVMALAEYRGDELAFVAPCVDGGATYAVADRLDALEAESRPDPPAAGTAAGAPEP